MSVGAWIKVVPEFFCCCVLQLFFVVCGFFDPLGAVRGLDPCKGWGANGLWPAVRLAVPRGQRERSRAPHHCVVDPGVRHAQGPESDGRWEGGGLRVGDEDSPGDCIPEDRHRLVWVGCRGRVVDIPRRFASFE